MTAPSDSTTEIGDLLTRLYQGEPAAKNLLIERCRERFRRRARQMLGDFPRLRSEVDTSDVEQELYSRLCKSLEEIKVNDVRHLLRLANLTLRRCLIDWARKTRSAAGPNQNEQDRVDPAHGPAKQALLAEVHEWVGKLPQEKQEVFDLIFYQEMTQAQAGQILGKGRKVVMRLVREIKLECIRQFGDDFV